MATRRSTVAEPEFQTPSDTLNKLSQALIQVSRGDPLVALRNELQTQFDAIRTRFEGIDKATELAHQDQVRVPTQIDTAIESLRDLLDQSMRTAIAEVTGELNKKFAEIVGELRKHVAETAEKFAGVKDQFGGRDTALAAALLAQKTSVDEQNKSNALSASKAEAGFTKEIDGAKATIVASQLNFDDKIESLKTFTSAGDKTIDDKIEDVRTRVGAIENQKKGAIDNWGAILGGLGLLVAVIAVIASFGGLGKGSAPTPIVIERSATGDKVVP
jgi:hypothetical protein